MGALFTCPHCSAVFFVGWDGQPEIAAPHEAEPHEAEPETPVEFDPNLPIENPLEMPTPQSFETEVPAPQEIEPEQNITPESFDPQGEAVSFESTDMPVMGDSFLGGESFAPAAAVETPTPVASNDFSDVVEYGNQSQEQGPLTYTVQIKGLELADTFERLREALTDSRFGWDTDELMTQVQNGCLDLKGLSPTKASILINRIKSLPIEVSWKQEIFGGSL